MKMKHLKQHQKVRQEEISFSLSKDDFGNNVLTATLGDRQPVKASHFPDSHLERKKKELTQELKRK